MAINPVQFADHVNEQFLRYQLTAFPITDPDLFGQAQEMLGDRVSSPLIKGPYVSISRSYKFGPRLTDLAAEGYVHRALPAVADHDRLFAHQYETLRQVKDGKHCLVSTGTGSGKTEAFLYPIIDRCLEMRDAGDPEGVVAILVYPMNALAIDQLDRLRHMLVGTGVSFGMYVGSTPANDGEAANARRLGREVKREEYARMAEEINEEQDLILSPWEERVTEKDMQESPPRLLLTNVYHLELLLTRGKDLGMFVDPPLQYLVFDEAHTYSGAMGAETACLIRRLRAFCRKSADDVTCIGTSATITNPEGTEEDAAESFAKRFFGVDPERVALVREQYEEQDWPRDRRTPDVPGGDTLDALDRAIKAIKAIEADDRPAVGEVYRELTGETLPSGGDTYAKLFDALKQNEMAYQICDQLTEAKHIREAVEIIWRRLKRREDRSQQAQAELLAYLALGAAARQGDNTLMRPKVHYFARGLGGAVVTFEDADDDRAEARLYFRGEAAQEANPMRLPSAIFPILVCKNCGQHYYRTWLHDLAFDNGEPFGGQSEGPNSYWAPAEEEQGSMVTFTDRFVSETAADEEDETDARVTRRLDSKRATLYACRHCGAFHKNSDDECRNDPCKRPDPLLPMYVLSLTGPIETCPACGHHGGQWGGKVREPIKPMRASVAADVHILGQDMLGAAEERRRKLICFADNRQDAAFQAGWMRDHARRYRMRHLIYKYIAAADRPASIGDLQEHLFQMMRSDAALRDYLAPEVMDGIPDEHFGSASWANLRKFLRIVLLRELATSFSQRDSLETWGVVRVEYAGLREDPEIEEWAAKLDLPHDDLVEGVAALLDVYRRGTHFHDEAEPIFSKWWGVGDEEILRGYLPHWDYPPKGLTLTKIDDGQKHLTQVVSPKGRTLAHDFASKWWPTGEEPEPEEIRELLRRLWDKLTELGILRPADLVSSKGNVLKGNRGSYQISSGHVGVISQRVRFRCNVCQRVHTRPTPDGACSAMHCRGTVVEEAPPTHDYNVAMLSQPFWPLLPEEHTAQVPAKTREAMEREFKRPDGRVNCFVATPTLELGVDIGDLDMILMRNVPPRPANYWQRAGRAGREHRMAVSYTYCRPSLHDEYFFEDLPRLLVGEIHPPTFNLKNEVLLRKHIHALVLSELTKLSNARTEDAEWIREALDHAFPLFVSEYLFREDRKYREEPRDVASLRPVIDNHWGHLLSLCQNVFAEHWPVEAAEEVATDRLGAILDQMTDCLHETISVLHRRMMWAVSTRRRLLREEEEGLLDEGEVRLRQRCEGYLRQLSEASLRTYTLSVLGREGFLPGYGAYEGSIVAFPQRGGGREQRRQFELSRPPHLAVREFVPGNMIYANRGRYRVALFHLPVGEDRLASATYRVDVENEVLCLEGELVQGYASDSLTAVEGLQICDCDLSFISSISDEEDYRFQLPVRVLGRLLREHNGGIAYSLDGHEMQHRFGQKLRLVNIGPADQVAAGELGFPICRVCGAVRSPYASDSTIEKFRQIHSDRCGEVPQSLALSSETQLDGLLLPSFGTRAEAVNFGEVIRIGAEQTMEMDSGDLQYVVIATGSAYDLFVYDVMPGGSGLLGEIIKQWAEVLTQASRLLKGCPAACDTSCYECMRTYYNLPHHMELDREIAAGLAESFTIAPAIEHELAPISHTQKSEGTGQQSNADRLLALMLQAGFPVPDREQPILIGPPYERTIPDLSYEDDVTGAKVAIYLDGLSRGIHGSAERQQQDRTIRQQLELDDWDVIEIANDDLNDPQPLRVAFQRIAKALRRDDVRERLR